MSRNGSGVYSAPPGSTAVPNTTISSSTYNALVADLVQDANTARPVVAGGTGAITADAAAKNLALISAKDLAGTGTVGGTANAITLTTARIYTALADTVYLAFKATADIAAGGTTINLDTLGAKKIRKVVAAGDVDVNVGDIIEDGIYQLRYDTAADSAAGAFILLNGSNNDPFIVGDFFDSARTLSSDWLRRDGALYDSVDYPELAAILPALPDGVDWSSYSSTSSTAVVSVDHDGDRYIALTSVGNVLVSDDGETWSTLTTIGATSSFVSLKSGNGIYVAVRFAGEVWVSPDAEVWTEASDIGTVALAGMAFGNSMFLVTGLSGFVATSPDGVTWTTRTTGSTDQLRTPHYTGTTWVVGTNLGKVLSSPASAVTWTINNTGASPSLYSVGYYGGMYIAVGASGAIYTSTNLTSWASRTSGTSVVLRSVIGTATGWLAVGESGVARISEDGITWTASATGFASTLVEAAGDPVDTEKYVVVGPANNILVGIRTLPTQFRVPSDDATYGWIKAVS